MPELSYPPICWVIPAGFVLSCLIEALLIPRPRLRRPLHSWLLHAGAWSISLAALYGLTGRPYFSAINVLCLWLLIVMVSNAKYHSLREPFVCADFEYFSDAMRFPRLFLPFFGIGKAIGLALVFVIYLAGGLYLEPRSTGALGVASLILLSGFALLALGCSKTLHLSFEASQDLQRLGLAASLWTYFRAARQNVDVSGLRSPFAPAHGSSPPPIEPLADLVSVQSESFFDVRRLWPGIRHQVLNNLDVLRNEALVEGRLKVAAWGANTVRTEFGFLTGISGDRLGVHRFNPYRLLARRGVPSIASHLRSQGYRTVCIHPYAGSFYGRDKVLPALGFDEFIDIRSFDDSQKAGPFIGDCAVADMITSLLSDPSRTQPLYIHAVTMENHGPLHLETVSSDELPIWFDRPLPDGLRDLAPYLRHIGNANRMLGQLRDSLLKQPRLTGLCFFGDHVPILPDVYRTLSAPDGDTDFIIWSNRATDAGVYKDMAVEDLASTFVERTHAQTSVSTRPTIHESVPGTFA